MNCFLIDGAEQGIGYYLVCQLLEEGNQVAVLDVETDRLKALSIQHPGRLFPYLCDVRDGVRMEECVNDAAAKMGRIDYAIHNACKCTFDALEQLKSETFHEVLDVNFYGAVRLTNAVLPLMKKQGHGKIAFTSSAVNVMGFSNISPYASSKGAIEAFARCMNIEEAGTGITFHIIHPPLTRTNSAAPLQVPSEFTEDPEVVGRGLAKRMYHNRFIITHSAAMAVQIKMTYLMGQTMGRFLSKRLLQIEKKA